MARRATGGLALALGLIAIFFVGVVSTALADSGTYLVIAPSALNESNCQTSDHRVWTCLLQLTGMNIGNAIAWTVSTSTPGITFTPSSGYLAIVDSLVQIKVSHLPCVNTTFLFSGQSLGAGVTPAVATWSCTPQPTPTPTPKPTPRPTPTPAPTPQPTPTRVHPTPVATSTPRSVTYAILAPPPTVAPGSFQESPTSVGSGMLTAILVASLIIFGTFGVLVLRIVSILREARRGVR